MMLETITEELIETLKTRTLALFGHAIDRVVLQPPPKLSMGDRRREQRQRGSADHNRGGAPRVRGRGR